MKPIIQQAETKRRHPFYKIQSLFRDSALQEVFDHKGYVVIDFLNADEIDTLNRSYSHLVGDLGNAAFASTIMSGNAEYRFAVSAVISEVFTRAVHETFRDAQFYWGNFNIKYPSGNMGTVPLHQDPSFLDERFACPLGIWVPLIDTSEENGALQVIPGSHTVLNQPRCGGSPFPFADQQEMLLNRFGRLLEMRAGQAYIGHPSLFHASPPNRSSTPRIVAAGLAGPDDSGLRYFGYKEMEGAAFAEMFEVDHSYYVSAPLFSRPDMDRYGILEVIPLDEPLPTQDLLLEILGNFKGE